MFLKMGYPSPFNLFSVFSNRQINVKECPSSIRHWDLNPQPLEYEITPIITSRLEDDASLLLLQEKFSMIDKPCNVFCHSSSGRQSKPRIRLDERPLKIEAISNIFFVPPIGHSVQFEEVRTVDRYRLETIGQSMEHFSRRR